MSVSASIDIHLSRQGEKPLTSVEIINVLTDSGWNLIHNEYISYLPLGDKDDFDWQPEKNMRLEKLIKILDGKEKTREIVGVMMSWKDTNIGGSFLFWPDNKYETFSINIDGNRLTTTLEDGYVVTDFQLYLSKLLPVLGKVWTVEYFEFSQHI